MALQKKLFVMNRRDFLKNSGKVILATSAIVITGNLISSCTSDDDDNFNGYYGSGYYDDGYYDDGYYDDGYYDDGYYGG